MSCHCTVTIVVVSSLWMKVVMMNRLVYYEAFQVYVVKGRKTAKRVCKHSEKCYLHITYDLERNGRNSKGNCARKGSCGH